jgi:hypothetical protein
MKPFRFLSILLASIVFLTTRFAFEGSAAESYIAFLIALFGVENMTKEKYEDE